jgi:hypothetical protein
LKPHAEVRAELQRRAKAPTSAHRDRFRANIILLRLEGLKIESVAKQLKTSMPTVSTWSGRFEAHGLDGLNDKAGRGRKPSIPRKKIERVVAEVTRPPKNRKRWSVRSMGPRRSIAQHRAALITFTGRAIPQFLACLQQPDLFKLICETEH